MQKWNIEFAKPRLNLTCGRRLPEFLVGVLTGCAERTGQGGELGSSRPIQFMTHVCCSAIADLAFD